MTFERCLATLEALSGREARIGYREKALRKVFGTSKVAVPLTFSRKDFFSKGAQYTKGLSISGIQQKLSLKRDPVTRELVPTIEGGEYILKPSPEEYPNAAENQHAAMRASELMGIETAGCALVAFSDGELAYLTRRFDRQAGGGKIHQEDLLQISDQPPVDKYRIAYESTGKLVDEATGGKMAVKLDLFIRILFAYVIGNNDLHMKNLRLQRVRDTPTGFYDKLSPNYDVLFAQAFDSMKNGQFLACDLLVDPETGEEQFSESFDTYGLYTGHDFIELGRRFGLRTKVIQKAIRQQIEKIPAILAVINTSYMPVAMKNEASALVAGSGKAVSFGFDR